MNDIFMVIYILKMLTYAAISSKTNVLFIIYDDLRPELSIYGRDHMITPNFERLAAQSVIFDNAYCQVAVCNPSRDSMLTGLRPDTTGVYSFQWTFKPLMIFPTRLKRSGYSTYGVGKVAHWDFNDSYVWDKFYESGWYEYQIAERYFMNSTTMPDRIRKEENFRDYEFTTKAIEYLRELHNQKNYFFLGAGFKLPHLAAHIPYKYFDVYRDKQHMWRLPKRKRKFPTTTPLQSYRCCADYHFFFMNDEGQQESKKYIKLKNIKSYSILPDDMRNELMWGYCAAITFLDTQLGRLLDVVDELSLWNNLTIILTSDHGIHNGEKGLW